MVNGLFHLISVHGDGSKISGGSGTKDIPGGIRQMYAFSRGSKEENIKYMKFSKGY